jgi:hypothetical protein
MRVRRARTAISVDAYPDAPVEGFRFERLDIEAETAGRLRHARDVEFVDSRIVAADGRPLALEDARDIAGVPTVEAER